MKRTSLILAVLVALLFSNCKKDATNTVDTLATTSTAPDGYTITAQNLLNVQSIKGLPNQDVKRISFDLLLPVEKYLVWVENAKAVSVDFTPEQKALTLDFINFLSPQMFDGKGQRGKVASFSEQWLEKAQKVFTNDQIRSIAYRLFVSTDVKNQVSVNAEASGGSTPNCDCASGSLISCDGGSFCPSDYSHGTCQKPSSWGCGWGWASACDNFCINPKTYNYD